MWIYNLNFGCVNSGSWTWGSTCCSLVDTLILTRLWLLSFILLREVEQPTIDTDAKVEKKSPEEEKAKVEKKGSEQTLCKNLLVSFEGDLRESESGVIRWGGTRRGEVR